MRRRREPHGRLVFRWWRRQRWVRLSYPSDERDSVGLFWRSIPGSGVTDDIAVREGPTLLPPISPKPGRSVSISSEEASGGGAQKNSATPVHFPGIDPLAKNLTLSLPKTRLPSEIPRNMIEVQPWDLPGIMLDSSFWTFLFFFWTKILLFHSCFLWFSFFTCIDY